MTCPSVHVPASVACSVHGTTQASTEATKHTWLCPRGALFSSELGVVWQACPPRYRSLRQGGLGLETSLGNSARPSPKRNKGRRCLCSGGNAHSLPQLGEQVVGPRTTGPPKPPREGGTGQRRGHTSPPQGQGGAAAFPPRCVPTHSQ